MTKKELLPKVTVVIATFNSMKVLPRTLSALLEQSYPRELLEILVVDGGSCDGTREFAQKNSCIVIDNPLTEPVNAKLLGVAAATGRYLVTLDHDEVLLNKDSILLKVNALSAYPKCRAALCSGYLRPSDYPYINQYISEFGDPYSYFMYQFSKGAGFLEHGLRRYYGTSDESPDGFTVCIPETGKEPLFELVCLGTMIDLDYCRSICDISRDPVALVHLFYIMRERGDAALYFVKNDPVSHYSADSLKAYFPKLKWRVCNNVHFAQNGEFSFTGRQRYQPGLRMKKYFFIPYALTLVVPFCEGVMMAIKRCNPAFLLHPVFCFYVAFQILWQYLQKLLGVTPRFMSYDGKKEISD